jgi:hypothetical protein
MLELDRPSNFAKSDLVDFLARRLGLVNYLELCTQTTGNLFHEINHSRFNVTRRLMYNCQFNFDDGLPIDFRIVDFDITRAIDQLRTEAYATDICLVDSWHTYECTFRHLTSAYDLLADGGVLVHYCLPPNESLASPEPKAGEWCGLSYKAFLDFVLSRESLDYCTIDVDYGCGIIFKNRKLEPQKLFLPSRDPKLISGWFAICHDNVAAFRFFNKHFVGLLRLTSAKQFVHNFSKRIVRLPLPNFALSP